jgi:hypothetical protein
MGKKYIYQVRGANFNSTGPAGKIYEFPFGSALKSFFVLASTGSGIASTDTLQILIYEMDPGYPYSGEAPWQLCYTSGSTTLISHVIVTGSLLNSGAQKMPLYDVKDYYEGITSTPRVMSPMIHCFFNITGSGNWGFRHNIVVED